MRKSDIPPSEFCPIYEDWDKFGTNISNKMLLNAAKCQAFNVPELLRENQRGGGVELPPPPHPD